MSQKEAFKQHIEEGYTFDGGVIEIGAAMLDGEVQTGNIVKLPLKMLNSCLLYTSPSPRDRG